ncbi:vitamin B12-dependent ribonucleotide reductase [Lujinxingia litoralis]|uniref:Vitamin B12-dependent ribonucleotide reductase n=1 Tax=Lujinxingia litoralis TaxID=2211119 RepID=A0A328C4L9_9DELT|nr:vitamin B12-dependent ribonucleotide reductase [Lujinxingia litoralis]RAL20944.1 vitamin B12-dependent ribonucleotide reductase [Lujinxingia litoralis]
MTTSIEPNVSETPATKKKSAKKVREFKPSGKGLSFKRVFTTEGVHPYDEVEWEQRTASIGSETGKLVFEQRDVEVPTSWSQMATNVVVSKYFRGQLGSKERETSIRQLIDRVANTITDWGIKDGYFASPEDAEVFRHELTYLVLHQKMAFNSPVWFNVGVEERPQASACFINSVSDTMESILELAKTEGMLFKWGSGTGSNLSTIRSSREQLRGGGTASGPVSFMKGYDAFAGVIKSGGKTRRAAKMVMLDIDHPDIEEFVHSKADEEKKAWALIEAGYDGGFNVVGGAYDSIFFQNANHSVRVSDAFMKAVEEGGTWQTRAVVDGRVVDEYEARKLMADIAEAAWICGDPGMQYDTTINDWHTCSNTDRIYGSNPCSEYMFLNDSACNLASLNLMTYRDSDGEFDVASFQAAVALTITAQEILVDNAGYPTPAIEKNSHAFRPLGLGYANLGALLMARGLPYDSTEGRAYAGAITALMCGEAYAQSAKVAATTGPFVEYPLNEEPMLGVIAKHRAAVENISDEWAEMADTALLKAARQSWDRALEAGKDHGYRNSQVTVLAPTGTIGFMMDCDTTGIEPDIALIKYKKLVGGGYFKIVNQTVPEALIQLGYEARERQAIIDYLMEHDTIEGAPALKEEHLPVFDCAFTPANGTRSIAPMGHVRMMAAAQPFLSGAISKTVNMPHEATAEDIADCYLEAWKLGLKAIAIYRDGCKRTQPLSTSLDKKAEKVEVSQPAPLAAAQPVWGSTESRRRLPDERPSITHKFSIAGHEGYITVGMYENGQPGELFIVMSKEGSVVSGLMDSFATSISLGLQYGVPLQVMVDKFSHTRFEPSGITTNPKIRFAKSVTDYIFRWLADKFLQEEERDLYLTKNTTEAWRPGEPQVNVAAAPADEEPEEEVSAAAESSDVEESEGFASARDGQVLFDATAGNTGTSVYTLQADAPPCSECGSIMVRSGACYKCQNCGSTSGCS